MKKPCPTLRKVPPQHMRSVASKLGLISNAGAFAHSALSRERALKYFFLFPRMIFQAPLRNRHNGRNAKSLYNARSILVGERLRTEPEIRFREYQESLVSSESGLRRSARIQSNQDFEQHLSNEIMRQVHEGYISRASSLASSPGLAQQRRRFFATFGTESPTAQLPHGQPRVILFGRTLKVRSRTRFPKVCAQQRKVVALVYQDGGLNIFFRF